MGSRRSARLGLPVLALVAVLSAAGCGSSRIDFKAAYEKIWNAAAG